jgi:hypothetical protein
MALLLYKMKGLFVIILFANVNLLPGQDARANSLDSVTTEVFTKLNNTLHVDLYKAGQELATLMSQLSFAQLDSIIENGNAVSKVYAYWSYSKKAGSDYRNHFVTLVKDTAKVSFVQYGCQYHHPEEVGEVIFDLAVKMPGDADDYPDYRYFLDSIAFELDKGGVNYGNINIRLANIKPPSGLETKLRERAKAGEVSAIMGLANFKKESDLPIFNALIQREGEKLLYSLLCIERFPHITFEDTLLNRYFMLLNDPSADRFSYTAKVLLKYSSRKVTNAIDTVVLNYNLYRNHLIALWKLTNSDIITYKELRKYILKIVGRKELNKFVANQFE